MKIVVCILAALCLISLCYIGFTTLLNNYRERMARKQAHEELQKYYANIESIMQLKYMIPIRYIQLNGEISSKKPMKIEGNVIYYDFKKY